MIQSALRPDSFEAEGWIFHKLGLKDLDMYSDYIRKTQYPTNVFAWNFAQVWADSRRLIITWKVIDDMLVIFRHLRNGEINLWSLPFGEGDLEKVLAVFHKCFVFCNNCNAKRSSHAVVKFINSPQIEFLSGSEKFNRLFYVKKVKNIDRLICINDLLTLEGKKYESLRRKINLFHRKHPETKIREYNPSDYEALMKLQKLWSETSGCKYKNVIDRTTYPEVLKHYRELNHTILVLEIDGEISGMVSGDISPTGCAWNFFIKAVNEIPGIYEVLMVELARKLKSLDSQTELLNVGGDSGIEGLSYFKEKYKPVQRLETFRIMLK